jgi:hypothetical protein
MSRSDRGGEMTGVPVGVQVAFSEVAASSALADGWGGATGNRDVCW